MVIGKRAVRRLHRWSGGLTVAAAVLSDGDGRCTLGTDPAWSDFIDNDFAADRPVVHEFDPASTPSFGGPITCADFDTWFGHDFTGL
jgi:hypothetical protein